MPVFLLKRNTIMIMTTKTGLTGLITGLITSFITNLVFAGFGSLTGLSTFFIVIAVILLIMAAAGGFIAVRWSKAAQPGRSIALGGLAGILDGTILFCLWGAAAAGSTSLSTLSPADLIPVIVNQTIDTFLLLFISGGLAGAIGGWLASSRNWNSIDEFDMADPQMAMNASITALPASIVAAGVAAAVFPRLAMLTGYTTGLPGQLYSLAVDKPLEAALFVVLVSHLAVTLVVPHETRQSQHLCGMDEVKMAAFVGIGAAPLLAGLLLAVYPGCFSNSWVLMAILVSSVMSLISLYSLVRLVLPKRAAFPPHPEGGQKAEAVLFGSIANSVAWRLVILCIGCGLMMVLPLHCTVISVLVNLNYLSGASVPVGQYPAQALVSIGLMAASSGVLILIYMVYLNLGRWFSRKTKPESKTS
jgi:hypothetical protein